jgi:hypothetical protein
MECDRLNPVEIERAGVPVIDVERHRMVTGADEAPVPLRSIAEGQSLLSPHGDGQ